MKKKTLNLHQLKVKSFATSSIDASKTKTVKGGGKDPVNPDFPTIPDTINSPACYQEDTDYPGCEDDDHPINDPDF